MAFTRPLLLLLWPVLVAFVFWLGRPARGPSRRRELTSLILRLVIITALIFSLAGAQLVRASDELSVVFLLDYSHSVTQQGRTDEANFVREALTHMGPNDRAGIVVFGEDAVVDRPVTALRELREITSIVNPRATDLAEALRLGLALFPAGAARRIVLISDGGQTVHAIEADRAARLAGATGAQVDVFPLTRANGPEALVADVKAPARLHQGEDFSLEISLEANVDTQATMRAFAGGALVIEQVVTLSKGRNAFALSMRAGEPGFTPFRVQIEPTQDTYFQNNTLSAFSLVSGPPRVLVVASDPKDSAQLVAALTSTGLLVDNGNPGQLPSSLGELTRYSSVVLVNTPASQLSNRQMAALQAYVRDLGGGLVAVGGPQSYGVGGWLLTPLEETLPVEMQVKDPKRFPAIAFAVVIDESGSMSAVENGIPKYKLAHEAAARVAESMHDFDEVTVVGFDTQATQVIGPFAGTDKAAAIPKILAIGPGGGGIYIFDSLVYARDLLAKSDKPLKHIILLADGADSEQQEGARELVDAFHKDLNITLTVVAIGDGSDIPFLQDIAARGGGRYYFTDRAATLPTILAQEAAEVQRSYIVEEPFVVLRGAESPIMSGIESAPQLLGYVATTEKAAAQVVLASPKTDPILAQWQYGLGRSVAFTSDASSRWAQQWVSWPQFAQFWSQTVRWTIRNDVQQNLEPRIDYQGERATVTVDALDNTGRTMNGMTMTLTLVAPSLARQELALRQIAPGRYSGEFVPEEEGAYLMGLQGLLPDGHGVAQVSGWVNPYPPEYRLLTGGASDRATLNALATIANGHVLENANTVFAHDLASERIVRDIWDWLLLLAILLWPIDIAVRRLTVSRYEIERALARVRGALRLPGGLPLPVPARERPENLTRLFGAKTRVEKQRATTGTPEPTTSAPTPFVVTPPSGPPSSSSTSSAPPPTTAPPGTDATAPADGTLAARLLKKKREGG